MKQHELIYSIDTIDEVARDIAQVMATCKVITFTGALGAGKTTLIQALLRDYGIYDDIQSPTFAYFNTYANARGQTFYHFDLYRMKSAHEFFDMGFHEYLDIPNSWALIEWPEIIMPHLKHAVCHIAVDYHGFERRRLRYYML